MKDNDQFYNGLVGFSFLTISVLVAPVASAETRGSSVASITPQMITRSGPVTITGSDLGEKGSGYVLIGGQRA